MENVERNYGYGVASSRAADLGNEELTVYRVGQEIGLDGAARNQKSTIAIFEAPMAEQNSPVGDLSTVRAGMGAALTRVVLGDFLASNPQASSVRNDGMNRLNLEAKAEIVAAEEEAYEMEERRVAVALAVAGMDLHTADEMASIAADQLAAEQTLPIEG